LLRWDKSYSSSLNWPYFERWLTFSCFFFFLH
jgi:hypothetical protein